MSRRLGRIENAILADIERTKKINPRRGDPSTVHLHSWGVLNDCFHPRDGLAHPGWEPTMAQRKSVTRAMRSFVRKFPRYALIGGRGRKMLYLYELADPVSVMWAKLSVERREFVPRSEAFAAMRAHAKQLTGERRVG
jgi:hypothetical protein